MSTVPAPVPAAQGPVEARSLSSITAIASNPPAYPRNPTHEKHDPLVLYIVRVPGSQGMCSSIRGFWRPYPPAGLLAMELTECCLSHPTDIFLSPLKPPTKSSVSAEAINASLYYLHVATPDDDAVLQEVEVEREEAEQRRREAREAAGAEDPTQGEFARMNNVRRKPVAGKDAPQENTAPAQEDTAPPPLPRRSVPMPQVSAENMSFAGTPVASAQTAAMGEPPQAPVDWGAKHTIPRRPLPPVPPSEEPWANGAAGEEEAKKTSRWSALAGRGSESWKEKYEAVSSGRHSLDSNRPVLPPRPSNDRAGSPRRSPGQSPTRQGRNPHTRRENSGFHITLIRRDPSSGTQWNVATISSPRMDGNAIDIDISTPGYNRFAASDEPLSLASLAASLPPGLIRAAGSSMPQTQSLCAEKPQDQPPSSGPRKFHRQLCVSKPYDDPTGSGRTSTDLTSPDGSSSKLKSGYYVFNSPWNGTCTFASSVNGRSLKCKHMIPGPTGHAPAGESDINPAVTVAELRFNTPFQAANLHYHTAPRSQPHLYPSSTPQNQNLPHNPTSHDPTAHSKRNSLSQFLNPNTYSRPRAHSGPNSASPERQRQSFHPPTFVRRTSLRAGRFARQSQFPGHPRRSTSTSSGDGPDSDEDRLDLSLAREPAGGGMRGKSAKLGKLIIEDEGIKMLDLVVAACMAVWWRGYYH